jgi:hypothetical protein
MTGRANPLRRANRDLHIAETDSIRALPIFDGVG